MKEQLMKAIAEFLQWNKVVKVFFNYNKSADVYDDCVTFSKDMTLLEFATSVGKLPKRVKAFENYYQASGMELVLE